MFLKQTLNLNPKLIDYASKAHQKGEILPDSYVLDMDSIVENAERILDKANLLDIELYFMLKQVGRNPYIAKKLIDIGYKSAVVVDFNEALVMMEHNIPIGNVGHLVQIPKHLLKKILSYGVEYVTVFSVDIIDAINTIAKELNIVQKIMIRVVGPEDELYPGQVGGFKVSELEKLVEKIKAYTHIELDTITAFPSLLFNYDSKKIEVNPNVNTMYEAIDILESMDLTINNRNMPSVTSLMGLDVLANSGATQGEPGHALTGTTPVNAYYSQYEKPAMIYVSEVSHNYDNKSYYYGGGLYRRGHMENVLVVDQGEYKIEKFNEFQIDSIDYYFDIDGNFDYGTTIIMAFRTQIFVTRSNVVLVEGIQSNNPSIIGIYDSQGKLLGDD